MINFSKITNEDADVLIKFANLMCDHIEDDTLLRLAASNIKKGLTTSDNNEYIVTARKQIVIFFLTNSGSAVTDSLFDCIRD